MHMLAAIISGIMKLLLLIVILFFNTTANSQIDTTLYGYADSVTFRQTEITPAFSGGPDVWQNYLKKYLKYPKDAKSNNIQGTVIVEFTISTDSKVSDVRIFQSLYPSLDKEAIRLIEFTPMKNFYPWVPAIQNGHAVKYRTRQSIPFQLKE